MTFVDDIVSDQVAPPWLQVGINGEPGVSGKYMQTIGLGLDAIEERALQAALVSLPGQGDPSALPFLGLDRVLVQGSAESDASFITRLSTSFDAWRVGGLPWGVLREILALFTGFAGGTPPGRTVSDLWVWDYYAAGADTTRPPTHYSSIYTNWNWDNDVEWTGIVPAQTPWWRYWLIIDSVGGSAWTTTEGNWGDPGNWGDGTESWGIGYAPGLFMTIVQILRSWQQSGAWCRWIVINFNSGSYDPNTINTEPDGHWGFWHKTVTGTPAPAGVISYVQSRDITARYVDGLAVGS